MFPKPSSPPPPTEVKKPQPYQKTVLNPRIEPTIDPPVVIHQKPSLEQKQKQYTHILSVLLQYNFQPQTNTVEENNRMILKEVAKILHNVVHTKMLGNHFYAPITWVQQGNIYSNIYYMNTELLGDVAVKKHTELLLNDVVKQIDDLFDHAFSKKEILLVFNLSKPLSQQVVI